MEVRPADGRAFDLDNGAVRTRKARIREVGDGHLALTLEDHGTHGGHSSTG